jgi:hypothetical protein
VGERGGFGDEQFRCRDVLVRAGVVLTDPDLVVPEVLGRTISSSLRSYESVQFDHGNGSGMRNSPNRNAHRLFSMALLAASTGILGDYAACGSGARRGGDR